jgi:hypothetical protein
VSSITYSTTLLASSNLALRRVGPAGITCNGEPVTQIEQLFRADFATVFGRGDGPVTFGFAVEVDFDTEAELLAFLLTHRETLPVQAALTLVDVAATVAFVMADAVRRVAFSSVKGNSVLVEYSFTGARFASEAVPAAPTDTDTVKAIDHALTISTVSQAIVYALPFASSPRGIVLTLSAPDGGTMFGFQIRESTRSATGFTVDFDAAVPASGYKLTGLAVL